MVRLSFFVNFMALHQKLYLIFSEHTLFTLVRENQQISDFCTSLFRKPYCLSSTCCGEEPKCHKLFEIMADNVPDFMK